MKRINMKQITKAQWKELKLSGCAVIGEKIVYTLSFIKSVKP